MIKMIMDPHIHSKYSGDATASPEDIIRKSKEIGLDAILGRGDTSGGSGLEHEHEKELEKEGHVE